MSLARRCFVQCAAAALAAPAVVRRGWAQAYPSRPIRIIVGFAPGGSTDVAARLVGQWLTERLGWQVVIENRAGAGSNIAAEIVVRAPPDGYTLLLVSSADTINATLYRKLNFVFLNDIVPVASLAQQPQVLLANPALPAKTLAELFAYAKSNPGKVTIASAGNGSISHLSGELLRLMAGIDMVHVPYRGSGPSLNDLLAGHVHTSFAGIAGAIEYARAGTLRVLAVTTPKRSSALPDVPSIGELVPGYEAVSLFGIGAPKGTPEPVVALLSTQINAALADPKVAARYADLGGVILSGTPGAFGKLLAEETEKWGKVIRAANIKQE